MAAIVEHDPEKACSALDAGWTPVFGIDHVPTMELEGGLDGVDAFSA
jgi:hypothetical protein